ncbi:hypothetical protein [Vreelandella gomseomensis]|uniref:AsmA-like C-terminal domain-containing protein n=1 Tax=Vreelandella gomseomensis TaxID=370766 RepID=A0ABU1GF21_9GAMM|nr:hypothetical protein [Halomonas gomseomensis]MDR5876084.1 hypothetical protein [Halomonas gomseomensis]
MSSPPPNTTPSARAKAWKRRLPHWFAITLGAGLGLLVLWLAGSYWLLNSQWLPERLSQAPGVDIRWEQGSSRHPGRWNVEELTIRRDDGALALALDADRATLELSLMALLGGEIHIKALDAEGIRELQLGDITLQGEGRFSLKDTTLSRDTLAIPQATLQLTQGRLVRGQDGATLARNIQLDASASLDRITPTSAEGGLDPELVAALSADARLSARADAWDVFMPYLSDLPWLAINGRGDLHGDISLDHGRLQPGSQVTLSAPALVMRVDEAYLGQPQAVRWQRPDQQPPVHIAQGDGVIALRVPAGSPDTLTLDATLDNVMLADRLAARQAAPYADNTHLEFSTALDNRRVDQLEAPSAAALSLEGRVLRLDMLARYLERAAADPLDGGITLAGDGRLALDVALSDNRLETADLTVTATALRASAMALTAEGNGTLHAHLPTPETFTATLNLTQARLQHNARPLLADASLTLTANSPLDPDAARRHATGSLRWEDATLPDISKLQPYVDAYLPDAAPLRLVSGQARSQGQLNLTSDQLSGDATLAGSRWVTDWSTGKDAHRLTSDMQLDLTINQAAMDASTLDVSGSRLEWQVSDASRQARKESTLTSSLILHEGRFQREDSQPSGRFDVSGSVQHLGFLNAFLPDAHGLALDGAGQLSARGGFKADRLTAPTRLRVVANPLRVDFLDYRASGRGELTAQLDSAERALLSLGIPRFSLARQGDDSPHVEGRHLALTTTTEAFSAVIDDPQPEHFTTRISLPIIDVPDITRYNAYLPEGTGVRLLDGQASLSSELVLSGMQGEGDVTFRAFGTELALLEQRLRGDIHMQLVLSEGDLAAMRFVANDSFLRLENVSRIGNEASSDAGWWAQLDMAEATLLWETPVNLDARLGLRLRDSGLLARLFLARARESDWLGRLLSVRNIQGSALLRLNDKRLDLNDLQLSGGPLLLLADLTLAEQSANGALYARLGRLGVGVELANREPTLKILQPRRWFEHWRESHRRVRP